MPGSSHQQLAVLGEEVCLQRQLALLRLLLLEKHVLSQRGMLPPLQLQGCSGPGSGAAGSTCQNNATSPQIMQHPLCRMWGSFFQAHTYST